MDQAQMHALVDPELRAGLAAMPSLGNLDFESLPGLRAQWLEMAKTRAAAVPLDGVEVRDLTIPGANDAPQVRALVYRPLSTSSPLPALLHLHGGGWVFGCPEGRHAVSVELTRSLRCVVVSVDYRLAPETRYPGAVEDGYSALKWLNENAQTLNVDPGRVTVTGESAGGGLAAALAILARDRGEYPIASQVLTYPMLDDRPLTTDGCASIGQHVWTRQNNLFGWSCYLGSLIGSDDVSPYAAAARCMDFRNLPPTYIACGDLDLFVIEDIAYAHALIRAGVAVELRTYPGAFHGFDLIESAGVSRRFQRDLRDAIARALAA
jgi:triacylglycerol lipase